MRLFACSGAKIDDFSRPQRTGKNFHRSTLAQLDRIDGSTDLITLTIGGNDLEFAHVLLSCATHSNCPNRFPDKFAEVDRLEPSLVALYDEIGSAAATGAEVGLLGYPQLFPAGANACQDRFWQRRFDPSERSWFRELTRRVDSMLRDAVAQAKSRWPGFFYVSTVHAFDNHDLCSKDPYVTGPVVRHPSYSFHPNARGQAALAKALEADFAPPAKGPAEVNPCVEVGADELFAAGDLIAAGDAYQTLLAADSPPSCATEGLLNVRSVELTLQQAVAEESAGQHDAAQALVDDLVKAHAEADFTAFLVATYRTIDDPVSAVRTISALTKLDFERAARELLADLEGKSQLPKGLFPALRDVANAGPFAAAVLLEASGLDDEARAEFEKALASDPAAAAVALSATDRPRELDTLRNEIRAANEPSVWANFKRTVIPWLEVLGEIALAALLALFLWRTVRTATGSPTEIKDFDDSAIEGTKAGKDLTALVRVAVEGLSADLPARSLDIVSALEASTPLPASVASAIPQLKFFAAISDLLQKVLPQRGWLVSGQLLARSQRGVGLALRLSRASGGVIAGVSLWAADFGGVSTDEPTDGGFDRLAIPAAVWIAYTITDRLRSEPAKRFRHPVALTKVNRRSASVPTRNWRSYACFAAGSLLQSDDEQAAVELYEKALRYDPANKAALYNRAVLDIKAGDWDLAADRLGRLQREFDPESTDSAIYYRYYYMSAVLHINRELDRGSATPRREPFVKAFGKLSGGLLALERILQSFDKKVSSRQRALYESLTRFEGPFVLALAGLVARLDAMPQVPREPAGGAVNRRELIDRLVTDPQALTTVELLEYSDRHTSRGYRTRYNLACYYSEIAGRDAARRSESLESAITHLRIALDESPGTGLDRWALADPSLETLRKDSKYGPEFYELVWSTTDPSPLGQVDLIGTSTAQKLAAASIDSAKKLVAEVADSEKRAALADRLNVKETGLETWSRVADLMDRTQATPREINLLVTVGIRSVDQLLAPPVSAVARALAEANAALAPKETAPPEARVRGWRLLANTS